MNRSFGILCATAIVMTIPGIAGAQSTTAFDGTYQGVSNVAAGGGTACTPFAAVPRPLTIRNGAAQFDAGLRGATVFEGTVSPQGELTMRDNLADKAIGKIDPSGKATASVNLGNQSCVITAVWQKQ